MITPASLEDALCEFLKQEVADKTILKSFDLKTKKENHKNPQVVKGCILPRFGGRTEGEDDTTDFPFICTRLLKLSDHARKEDIHANQHVVKVKILFGVYCPGFYDDAGNLVQDGSGYRDIWNLIEKTRQALFKKKIIDKKYLLLDSPFEAEFPEEQPYPQWEGWITAYFYVGLPAIENSF